jgi:hypothetical protein
MQIFVKLPKGKSTTIEVEPTDKIEDVKVKLQKQSGYPSKEQTLTYEGKSLLDGHTISEYSIQNDATLQLIILIR